ncbi:hypothetical protein OROMI_005548 [Orobanche minor]
MISDRSRAIDFGELFWTLASYFGGRLWRAIFRVATNFRIAGEQALCGRSSELATGCCAAGLVSWRSGAGGAGGSRPGVAGDQWCCAAGFRVAGPSGASAGEQVRPVSKLRAAPGRLHVRAAPCRAILAERAGIAPGDLAKGRRMITSMLPGGRGRTPRRAGRSRSRPSPCRAIAIMLRAVPGDRGRFLTVGDQVRSTTTVF